MSSHTETESPESLGKKLNEAEQAHEIATSQLNTAREAKIEAEQLLAETQQAFDTTRNAYTERQRQRQSRLDEARELRDKAREYRERHAGLQEQLRSNQEAIEGHDTRRVELERQLNDLDAEGGAVDVNQLTAQAQRLQERITALKEQIDAKGRADQVNAEFNNCLASAERQRSMYDAASAIVDAIKVIREEIIAELVKPLTERMQAFFDAGGIDRRVYCDLESPNGKPIFSLGWIVEDIVKRPMDALSGGETALFTAALAYALVQLADPPLRLLLIEAGECDMPRLFQLLDAIRAVQDDIGNCIVTTHLAVDCDYHDWRIVKLEAAAASVA